MFDSQVEKMGKKRVTPLIRELHGKGVQGPSNEKRQLVPSILIYSVAYTGWEGGKRLLFQQL